MIELSMDSGLESKRRRLEAQIYKYFLSGCEEEKSFPLLEDYRGEIRPFELSHMFFVKAGFRLKGACPKLVIHHRGMDKSKDGALWKTSVQPGTVTLYDDDRIFFWFARVEPSRYIEGLHPGNQIMKTSAIRDLHDSDDVPPDPEQLSGNAAAEDLPDWVSFVPLVPGVADDVDSSDDNVVEAIGSNCLCCPA
ncbi:hypothetical protein R1sor_014771 [Riccia sorocarpa]|uniref:Uncharacterized protein n=1 Tax=Riccia sorocarpa TaxID=122646 RepID=A0ABD3HCY6_9MARC